MGFGQSALAQYLNGKIPLNVDAGIKFANLLDVPLQRFSPSLAAQANHVAEVVASYGGLEQPSQGSPLPAGDFMRVVVAEEGDPNFYAIPKVKLQLSAGVTGFQTVPEIHDGATLAMAKNWVDRNGYNPAQLIALTVKGESMEPNLYEGDLVVVNTADIRPVDGHVYAVNYEGEAVIKRLEKDGPVWYLASDNPAPRYRRKSVRDGHTIIVGRVVRRETDRI